MVQNYYKVHTQGSLHKHMYIHNVGYGQGIVDTLQVLRSEASGNFANQSSVRADATHEGPRIRASPGELCSREIKPWVLQNRNKA